MKSFRKQIGWFLGGCGLIVLLVIGYWPSAISVEVAGVARGSVQVTVDGIGETRIREKYVITAPVTGKQLRVILRAGDTVARGETELLRFLPVDPALLDVRVVAESEARVKASEAAVSEANSALTIAETDKELAQQRYDRALSLIETKSISDAEFEEALHGLQMAQATVRTAEYRVKARTYENQMARAALLTVSDFSQNQAESVLRVISPIDGRVLRVMQIDSGVITAGTPILEIGDPRDLELEIEVLSQHAVGIVPGSKVMIDYWGGETVLKGTVRLVEPAAFLKVSALGVEEKRVKVIADFEDPWDEWKSLGDGYRIEARIVTRSSSPTSLKVPTGALFRLRNQWHLFRVRNQRAELVAVEVGYNNGREAEIVSGVTEGDAVILHPPDNVQDGVKVLASGSPVR